MTSTPQQRVLPGRVETEHADLTLAWEIRVALTDKWVWLVIEVEGYPDILEGVLYELENCQG